MSAAIPLVIEQPCANAPDCDMVVATLVRQGDTVPAPRKCVLCTGPH